MPIVKNIISTVYGVERKLKITDNTRPILYFAIFGIVIPVVLAIIAYHVFIYMVSIL